MALSWHHGDTAKWLEKDVDFPCVTVNTGHFVNTERSGEALWVTLEYFPLNFLKVEFPEYYWT